MKTCVILYSLVSILSFRFFSRKSSKANVGFFSEFFVDAGMSLLWPITWAVILVMAFRYVKEIRKERRKS